jgi:hypothetical protein
MQPSGDLNVRTAAPTQLLQSVDVSSIDRNLRASDLLFLGTVAEHLSERFKSIRSKPLRPKHRNSCFHQSAVSPSMRRPVGVNRKFVFLAS